MDDHQIKPCSVLLHKLDANLDMLLQFQHSTVSSSTSLHENLITGAETKNGGVTYELNKKKETNPDKKISGGREAAEDFLEILSMTTKKTVIADTATVCSSVIQNCGGNRVADLNLTTRKKITNKKKSLPTLVETLLPPTRKTPPSNQKNIPACILCSMPGGTHAAGCLELLDFKSLLSGDPKPKVNRKGDKSKCQNSYNNCKVSKTKKRKNTQHVGHKCTSQKIKINSFSLGCCSATRCSDIKKIIKKTKSNTNVSNTANISTSVDSKKSSINIDNVKSFYMDMRKHTTLMQKATFEFDKKVNLCFIDILTKCNYMQKNENSETLSCLYRTMSGLCDKLQECVGNTTDTIDNMIFSAGFADHATTAECSTQAGIVITPATSTTKISNRSVVKKNHTKSNIFVKDKQNIISFARDKFASEADLNVKEQQKMMREFRNQSTPVFISDFVRKPNDANSFIAIDAETCLKEYNDTSLQEVHCTEPNFVREEPTLFDGNSDEPVMVKCEPDICDSETIF